MKRLPSTLDGAELGLLMSRLEAAGIACDLRGEQMSQTLHTAAFPVGLWILDDEQYPRAAALWDEWRTPPTGEAGAWTCPGCGEALDAQFAACWKCGAVWKAPA